MGLLGLIGAKQRVSFIQMPQNVVLIQFDASLKEVHKRESPPTQFPVEDGSVISDHVIVKPFSVELTAIITDTPLSAAGLLMETATTLTSALIPPAGLVAGAAGYGLISSLAKSQRPSVAAYNQLLNIQAAAQNFDVLTSIYRYPSMWISSISAPRDSTTGSSLIFDISMTQLILVSPQSVNVQIFANPGLSANKADLGQQGLNIPNGFTQGQAGFHAATGTSAK